MPRQFPVVLIPRFRSSTPFARFERPRHCIPDSDFVTLGGEAGAKEAGKMRLEGKDYTVQDGDIMGLPLCGSDDADQRLAFLTRRLSDRLPGAACMESQSSLRPSSKDRYRDGDADNNRRSNPEEALDIDTVLATAFPKKTADAGKTNKPAVANPGM